MEDLILQTPWTCFSDTSEVPVAAQVAAVRLGLARSFCGSDVRSQWFRCPTAFQEKGPRDVLFGFSPCAMGAVWWLRAVVCGWEDPALVDLGGHVASIHECRAGSCSSSAPQRGWLSCWAGSLWNGPVGFSAVASWADTLLGLQQCSGEQNLAVALCKMIFI